MSERTRNSGTCPPQGASGQQLVEGVVGVQNRGVAPPGGTCINKYPMAPNWCCCRGMCWCRVCRSAGDPMQGGCGCLAAMSVVDRRGSSRHCGWRAARPLQATGRNVTTPPSPPPVGSEQVGTRGASSFLVEPPLWEYLRGARPCPNVGTWQFRRRLMAMCVVRLALADGRCSVFDGSAFLGREPFFWSLGVAQWSKPAFPPSRWPPYSCYITHRTHQMPASEQSLVSPGNRTIRRSTAAAARSPSPPLTVSITAAFVGTSCASSAPSIN